MKFQRGENINFKTFKNAFVLPFKEKNGILKVGIHKMQK